MRDSISPDDEEDALRLSARTSSSFRLIWLVAGLVLACASPPVEKEASVRYAVEHDGFGVRARLDGWQVYQDPATAPAVLRPAFGNKRGPDDPPLFVAMRESVLLTALVLPAEGIDSEAFFYGLVDGMAGQGEVTRAVRLTGSEDILYQARVGPRGFAAYSHGLVHSGGGRIVNISLVSAGQAAAEGDFFDAIRAIELRGEDQKWAAPWQLRSPVAAEPLPGYGAADLAAEDDPFEAVECPVGSHPLLFSTPSSSGRLYLFGSIHFGHPSFYPFAPVIEAAFAAADRLVVEVDVNAIDDATMSRQVMEVGALPPGETLAQRISADLYGRLGEAATDLGVPVQMFDGMTPGTAGMVLGSLPFAARGFDPADGVDLYFLQRAETKTVVELETLADQLAIIEALGTDFLRSTVDSLETIDQDIDLLHAAWRCGDEESLVYAALEMSRERAATEEERAEIERIEEVFLYRRNEGMTARIIDVLESPGDTFVVVGAAHLIGDRGIPALLRAAGHAVDRVGSISEPR